MAEATTVAELVELAKTQDESSDEYLVTLEQLKAIATSGSGTDAVDAAAGLDEVLKGAAGAQGAAGGSTGGSAQGEQTWLVQRALESGGWMDVGDVVVAPRTKRRTIVEKALEVYPDHAPPKDHEAVAFRVLDADSAAGILVRWEVPPAPAAVLRIG